MKHVVIIIIKKLSRSQSYVELRDKLLNCVLKPKTWSQQYFFKLTQFEIFYSKLSNIYLYLKTIILISLVLIKLA